MKNIQFKEWQKLDLRAGKILDVEDIIGADKLYKLKVSLGKEERILVAGIKEFYAKKELKGKKCIVFTNLEPKTMRGVESKGMLLAAVSYDEEGNEKEVRLLQPDADIEIGSKIC